MGQSALLAVGAAEEWPSHWNLGALGPRFIDPLTPEALAGAIDCVLVILNDPRRVENLRLVESARRDAALTVIALARVAPDAAVEKLLALHPFDAFIDMSWPAPVALACMLAAMRQVQVGRNLVEIQRLVLDQSRRETETLYDMAVRDDLTHLYNQRHFSEMIGREHDRSRRQGRPYAFVYLDLDHLKEINHAHGHAGGSKALSEFARLLAGALRLSDIAIRLGGDEFVVFLADCDKRGAHDFAERLCQRVREHVLVVDGARVHLSVSAGIASYPEHALHHAELLKRADQALYRAKEDGRDRVAVASALSSLAHHGGIR